MEIKERILQLINERSDERPVSFVELTSMVDGFSGDYRYGFPKKNIWTWFDISKEAADAMDQLQVEKLIKCISADVFTYLIDGRVPDVELAKQDRIYKVERWLPVCWVKYDFKE